MLCALMVSAAALAQKAAWPPADAALLHSARLWEIRDRGDLAQAALEKLIAARPDSPQALVELGELDIRIGELSNAAQVLNRIRQRFADTPAARDFEIEYRIATRDRLQLALIRRMLETRRVTEARAALVQLFPGGAPDNTIGIEYYHLLAGTPNGWLAAYQGLKRLVALHPDDPNYQFALARHLLRRDERAQEAVLLLDRLAQRDDLRVAAVDQLLAEAFRELPPLKIPSRALQSYLQRHPDDPTALAVLAQQRRAIEQRQLLARNALAAIEPQLQQQLIQSLQSTVAQRSAAASTPHAQALMRVLSPELSQQPLPFDLAFDDSSLEAALWLERSRRSKQAQQIRRAAAELQAAIAFHRKNFEGTIASAEEIEALGGATESGALLASAGRLAPRSSWLFETRIRWLIAHQQASEALALLEQRPIDRQWTGASRDELVALALAERATQRSAAGGAGDAAAAIADLEAAVRLSPRDPWLRYRLAGLYQGQSAEHGATLMSEGVTLAPSDPQMRYAQALYLSSVEQYAAAYAAVDSIAVAQRTDGMSSLHDRLQIALARIRARELHRDGEQQAARATLLELEPLAATGLDRARALAWSWTEIGDPAHGLKLLDPYRSGPDGATPDVLLTWAQLLNSAEQDLALGAALEKLQDLQLSPPQQLELARLRRALDLRTIRSLERDGQYRLAQQRLDELLAADPDDRALRLARAELDLTMGHPQQARDRLAVLVAEQPGDIDARLSYARALTESGDLALARLQLRLVEEHMPDGDIELQVGLARRQLALGDANAALISLKPLLDATPTRTDVLLLAAAAESSLHHFAMARAYYERAEHQSSDKDLLAARRARAEIEARLQSGVATALQVLHQPGVPGVSQLDALTIPGSWIWAHGYEQRFIAHTDAVSIESGHLSTAFDQAASVGTVQAAGPGAPLRFSNDRQSGLSLAGGFQTDTLNADIGTTPLGFDLSNIVGGAEWTPTWRAADLTLGIARRAVTSSALSYAGWRDPITGATWGGVVANGPYAGLGIYKERYSVSGSVRYSELTGTHVLDNQFFGARAAASWKFYGTGDTASAYTGLTLNYWGYEHNLSNYTYGSGGYYSPHSYLSTALPLELTGVKAGWSYQLRASIAYSVSEVASSPFYPDDPALQAAASRQPLPSGFDAPVFGSTHGNSFSVSAYAALERQVTHGLVLGAMIDIDRTDYYHPTLISLYLRHVFSPFATPLASPPRPTRAYNQ